MVDRVKNLSLAQQVLINGVENLFAARERVIGTEEALNQKFGKRRRAFIGDSDLGHVADLALDLGLEAGNIDELELSTLGTAVTISKKKKSDPVDEYNRLKDSFHI